MKKLLNMNIEVIPVVIGGLWTVPRRFEKRLEELEISESQNYPNYSIAEIG